MSKDEYLITDTPLKALTVFAMPMILGSFFHHLAGAAAHHHNVATPQPGCLRQLPCGVRRLLPHLFQQVGALYLMNDPSHSYLPFLA